MAKKFNELRKKMSPERQERARAKTEAMLRMLPLYELRLARKLSQEQVAATLNIRQAAVSKLEHRTDVYISTLRRYIQAMGGTLTISADFPDGKIIIDQFHDIEERGADVELADG